MPDHGPFGRVVEVPDHAASRTCSPEEDRLWRGLSLFLLGLVPMCIFELRAWSEESIERARRAAVDQITSHGDDLLYGGQHRKTARIALARAMAIGAHSPGGITAFGVHACVHAHPSCPPRNAQ